MGCGPAVHSASFDVAVNSGTPPMRALYTSAWTHRGRQGPKGQASVGQLGKRLRSRWRQTRWTRSSGWKKDWPPCPQGWQWTGLPLSCSFQAKG